MINESFEEELEGFDDRFEVSGEMIIELAGDAKAEVERVIFAWKLCNPDEDLSMQELLLVLVGSSDEIVKVVSAVKGTKVQPAKGKKGRSSGWAVLRLKKAVMHEVLASANDERTDKVPFFMFGAKRTSMVFNMENYDLVAWE